MVMLGLASALSITVLRDCWNWSLTAGMGESAAEQRSIQQAWRAIVATRHRKIKDALEIID
jgi:hypothetical protein